MKKVMMMMAVIVAAVTVNAASANWGTGNVRYLSGVGATDYATSWQGQTAYFFLVSSASYDTSALVTSLSNGGVLGTAGADASKALVGSPSYAASLTIGQTKTDFANGEYAYGYAVIYRKDNNAFAISDVGTSAIFVAGANAALNLGGTANFTVYEIVPEPTSMALLAFGVAALGLRRRFKK